MKRIWIVAGEASGDSRAAEVMRAMHALDPGIEFIGAGGPKMHPYAVAPFDVWTEAAGVVGLWDVIKNYDYFHEKFHGMLAAVDRDKPDAVVLVDYPGFNLRLAKALRKRHPALKIIYYISPQVWAWNRGRIPKMARWLDVMLCIFPFEKELYEASGLPTEFVGHPLVDRLASDKKPFKRRGDLLGLFPGSREREVRRIFPALVDAAEIVQKSRPEIRLEAAAANPSQAEMMRAISREREIQIEIGIESAHDLMQRATVGIVTSGTATLEAAFFELPYCLVYKTAWLTYAVGKRLVKVNHLGIVNILAKRTVVREFIQDAARPSALADEMLRLLNDMTAREDLQKELSEVVATLGGRGAAQKAARAIFNILDTGKDPILVPER